MKRRKLLFLIRKHSCFLNHSNIIYAAIFIPVLPVAIMCSSCPPPTWEVKRSYGHFTPPPHAQYDHYRVGIKWGQVSYGAQSSIATWGAVTLPLYFPSQLVRLFLLLNLLIWPPLCNWAAPHPSGSRGQSALSHQMYRWLSSIWCSV